MNELSDQSLLRDYAKRRSEIAFAEIVRRHVDLVYSAALRMVRDPHTAQDVTQTVFLALAKQAPQLADHPVLSGWLHCTARNLASKSIRSDLRRCAREQEAVAMNELIATDSDAVWKEVAPHLDDALGELSEPDRDALLLRYFERKSAREMAQALGITDDAAQKRVSRAVERLREFFSKRGVTVGASGLAVVISANAVQAAPIGFAITISSALVGTTLASAATATAIKTIAMTTLQKSLITAIVVAAVGAGIYEVQEASKLRSEIQSLREQQTLSTSDFQKLASERDNALRDLAALQADRERMSRSSAELPKLRGEVARLREVERELAQLKAEESFNPAEAEMKSWLARVNQLKQRLEAMPDQRTPELQLVTEQDWLNAARGGLETDKDFRKALSQLRAAGEDKFARMLQPAWTRFLEANRGKHPSDLAQLQPYFDAAVDTAILRRYEFVPAGKNQMGSDWLVTQKASVDEEFDGRFKISPNGWSSSGAGAWKKRDLEQESIYNLLSPAKKAYQQEYGVSEPSDYARLRPFVTTPEQQAALEKLIEEIKVRKESEAQ